MGRYLLTIAIQFAAFTAPYAEAAEFDYGNYEQVLTESVRRGEIDGIELNVVDYALLGREARRRDSAYSRLLEQLAAFDPSLLAGREERMAFWINVYNIAAIKTIVDHYPVDSIRSWKISLLGLPWNRKAITVGGKEYALGGIEFDILVEGFRDLRVHFGINCASVSCVDLLAEPYRPGMLDRQLEEQGRRFLADPKKGLRPDRERNKVFISQAFKFDQKHFDAYADGAVKFILPYSPEEHREYLRKGGYDIEYLDYDWKSNDRKHAKLPIP